MPEESLRERFARLQCLIHAHYCHWQAEVLEEVDSTSSEARRRIVGGSARGPFVLMALHQTAGRGRQDRQWNAPAGQALLFTAAAPLAFAGSLDSGFGRAQSGFPITLWPLQAALVLALRLRMLGWQAELKWPNDVLLGGRKVSGVLCEVCHGWLMVGVGVNLLQTEEELALIDGARVPAASLATVARAGAYHLAPEDAVLSLVQGILAVIESPWPQDRMLRYYREWCVTLGTKVATVDTRGEAIAGVASWVNEDGSLAIELPGGEMVRSVNEIKEVS